MFNTLLESRRNSQRSPATTAASVVAHIVMIAGTVIATEKVKAPPAPPEEVPAYVDVRPAPEPERTLPNNTTAPNPAKPRVALPSLTLASPIEIPTSLPPIDFTGRLTDERDFVTRMPSTAVGRGEFRDTSANGASDDRFPFEVDKVAKLAPDNPEPGYPNILRATGQTGRVVVSFVIDTTGKADMSTYRLVSATHPLFEAEVKEILPRYRFVPAEIANRKVRMFVNLPFEFRLNGKGGG